MNPARRGALYGILAAATFGASAPLCKLLLASAAPVALAGLLYAGAAVALSLYALGTPRQRRREARLRPSEWPLYGAVIVLGGIVGPVLMLVGLLRVSAVTGALLLSLEGPFTAALAVLAFGEHMGRRAALATALVLGGAALLAAAPGAAAGGGGASSWAGAAAIAGACLAWALDNNLTQRLSLRDPVFVVRGKAAGAAAGNLAIALALGHGLPAPPVAAAALAIGAVSYGASVLLDAYALRLLGAVREAAYFATAPFVGAAVGAILFRRPLSPAEWAAGALMAGGVAALVRERHAHQHTHDPVEHEHVHRHDEHHQHAHAPGDPPGEPHAHPHRHEALTHSHPHVPDLHHRHRH
jgi:drug/metabolite transporter (DMT)-like permease